MATALARPRLFAVLLSALSGLALIIAGVGVFGVLSYNVAQRRRDIGVRAARGARPRAARRAARIDPMVAMRQR